MSKLQLMHDIFGPAVLLDDAVVAEKAIILGPAVIGRNAIIGESSFLENCVLWDGAVVRENCCLRNSLVDYNAVISCEERQWKIRLLHPAGSTAPQALSEAAVQGNK